MRYLITLSYDGTNYKGYQTQPGLVTIQEQIEKALTKINDGKKTTFTSSGRTDKGVHAKMQCGHADLDINITEYKLKRAMNSNLPEDIHVIKTEKVADDFHARYNVLEKTYEYYMNIGEYNPIERNYVFQYNYKLNVEKMQEGIKYLLGEHDLWAKSAHPWYNETVHIPMFLWDPRYGIGGERRNSLVQNIDIPVTLLKYFGLQPTKDMLGKDLSDVIKDDTPIRDYALFGMHGAQVNITDGRYVYMRSPKEDNKPLFHYTQMPTHMRCPFSTEEMRSAKLYHGFSFTKKTPVMQIEAMEDTSGDISLKKVMKHTLYDLKTDPYQMSPIHIPEIEEQMIEQMIVLMRENDAPKEQYVRLGFH